MPKLVGVRFRDVGRIYYFDYPQDDLKIGNIIIADTRRGIENGRVVLIKNLDEKDADISIMPKEKIIRKATASDLKSLKVKQYEEAQAAKICKNKIEEHKLKMKLIGTAYAFNRSKLTFYFVAEGRVDFRSLVKDLSHIFKIRIELRQVGIRDEAKTLGGIGICGRPFCCSTFLDNFNTVSVKMAKDQGMSMNPNKLSGTCGRLLCCLGYEQETYLDLIQSIPEIGAAVQTENGPGVVVGQSVINNKIRVILGQNAEEGIYTIFDADKVEILK